MSDLVVRLGLDRGFARPVFGCPERFGLALVCWVVDLSSAAYGRVLTAQKVASGYCTERARATVERGTGVDGSGTDDLALVGRVLRNRWVGRSSTARRRVGTGREVTDGGSANRTMATVNPCRAFEWALDSWLLREGCVGLS